MIDIGQVKKRIRDYILEVSPVDQKKIKEDTLIFQEGYFDSMGFVLLITFLEENFNIEITDSELVEENFESINAITDLVNRKTN